MRKIMTCLVMVVFLSTAMFFSGCATSGSVKELAKMAGKQRDEIALLKIKEERAGKNILGLQKSQKEIDKRLESNLDYIDHVGYIVKEIANKTNTEFKPFKPEAITVAKAEVTTPAEATTEASKVSETPEVVKLEVVKPELVETSAPAPAPLKAKIGPVTAETLEDKLAKLTKRVDAHEKRLNRHDSRFSDLRRRLAEVEDEISPVYLWTAPFKTNSAKLTKAHEEGLDKLVIEILAGRVELIQTVVGHADPRGDKEHNEKLSKERAQSCIDYLVKKLGANEPVKWFPGQKWLKYFTAVAGGETTHYGNFQYNRRVQFKKR